MVIFRDYFFIVHCLCRRCVIVEARTGLERSRTYLTNEIRNTVNENVCEKRLRDSVFVDDYILIFTIRKRAIRDVTAVNVSSHPLTHLVNYNCDRARCKDGFNVTTTASTQYLSACILFVDHGLMYNNSLSFGKIKNDKFN